MTVQPFRFRTLQFLSSSSCTYSPQEKERLLGLCRDFDRDPEENWAKLRMQNRTPKWEMLLDFRNRKPNITKGGGVIGQQQSETCLMSGAVHRNSDCRIRIILVVLLNGGGTRENLDLCGTHAYLKTQNQNRPQISSQNPGSGGGGGSNLLSFN